MLIGICGGIGSGKSVVSRALRCLGYTVYDCDSEAKRLMNSDVEIKRRICEEISSDVTDGICPPDRVKLADIVVKDEAARLKLNAIVHGAVKRDVEHKLQMGMMEDDFLSGILFVEAAVMAESGLADACDLIWNVDADRETRLERVMKRDECTREYAESWIEKQLKERELIKRYADKMRVIYNDEGHSLLEQITRELRCIKGIRDEIL